MVIGGIRRFRKNWNDPISFFCNSPDLLSVYSFKSLPKRSFSTNGDLLMAMCFSSVFSFISKRGHVLKKTMF